MKYNLSASECLLSSQNKKGAKYCFGHSKVNFIA